MKRYVVFAGDNFYPEGGWFDHRGSFDSEADAKECATALNTDWGWCHIVDADDQKIIYSKESI